MPFSSNAIHNAYDGKTLAEGIQDTLTGSFKSWDEIRAHIINEFIRKLYWEYTNKLFKEGENQTQSIFTLVKRADQEGENKAQNILKKYNITELYNSPSCAC